MSKTQALNLTSREAIGRGRREHAEGYDIPGPFTLILYLTTLTNGTHLRSLDFSVAKFRMEARMI